MTRCHRSGICRDVGSGHCVRHHMSYAASAAEAAVMTPFSEPERVTDPSGAARQATARKISFKPPTRGSRSPNCRN